MNQNIYSSLLKNIETLLQDGISAQLGVILDAISKKYDINIDDLRNLSSEVMDENIKIKFPEKTQNIKITKNPVSLPINEEIGSCPYIFKRGRVGEKCGAKPKKGGFIYCTKHQKQEAEKVVKVPELTKSIPIDPTLRLIKLNKDINKFIHPESGLFVKSKEDSTIIGSYRDGVLREYLTTEDIKLCEKFGFLYEKSSPPIESSKKEEAKEETKEEAKEEAKEETKEEAKDIENLSIGKRVSVNKRVNSKIVKSKPVRENKTSILKNVPKPIDIKSSKKKKKKNLKSDTKDEDIEEVLEKVFITGEETDTDNSTENEDNRSDVEDLLLEDD